MAFHDAEMADGLRHAVTRAGFRTVGIVQDGVEAVKLVRLLKPEIVLLDQEILTLNAKDATRQIVALGTTAVVLLMQESDSAFARETMDVGACAYMVRPFDTPQLGAILEVAWHRFHTTQALQDQTRSLNETLEVRKIFEKAKGILMQQQNLSEEQAHRTIQKLSQDQGIPIKDLCQSIVQVKTILGKERLPGD